VAVECFPATATPSPPASFRHVSLATAFRSGTDPHALALPDSIVAVTWADQCVGNLVQEGVEDLIRAVALDQMDRQLNPAPLVNAQPQRLLEPVPAECPTAETVGCQELECNQAHLGKALVLVRKGKRQPE
jgi:hypothetical protein